jgi:hypothetical protein
MPVLMAYGYSREDLEMLVEDCVTLVSIHRKVWADDSYRVLDLLSINVFLRYMLQSLGEENMVFRHGRSHDGRRSPIQRR